MHSTKTAPKTIAIRLPSGMALPTDLNVDHGKPGLFTTAQITTDPLTDPITTGPGHNNVRPTFTKKRKPDVPSCPSAKRQRMQRKKQTGSAEEEQEKVEEEQEKAKEEKSHNVGKEEDEAKKNIFFTLPDNGEVIVVLADGMKALLGKDLYELMTSLVSQISTIQPSPLVRATSDYK